MAKKIKFNVIHASGEDEKHKASELDKHGPAIRGWQSSRNCDYPQEIILFLHRPTILQQIQILAHQYLISERIDLWIGPEVEGAFNDLGEFPRELSFEFLGYILLSDNAKSDFKSRELKSITVPSSPYTSFVKLSLHQNHVNELNEFNQVSIVAIQILGDERKDSSEVDSAQEGTTVNSSYAPSVYDDLAFEMYVDRDIANIIRSLDARKLIAVQDERYEYAKKLKLTIDDLRIVGEKLGKLEIAKRQAIQEEDYSRAKRKKTQIETLKKEIHERINIDNLLEKNGVVTENDEESDVYDKEGTISNATSAADILNPPQQYNLPHLNGNFLNSKQLQNSCEPSPPLEVTIGGCKDQTHPGIYESPVSPLHGVFGGSSDSPSGGTPPVKPRAIIVQPVSIKTGSFRRRNKSAEPQAGGRNSYEAYDERTVPAQRNMHSSDTTRENTIAGGNFGVHSKLNEREKKQAALPTTVFGLRLVEKFYSKHFSDKEEGLRLLEAHLKTLVRNELKLADNQEIHSPNKIARATIFLLHRALRDKVFAVYNVSTEVIRYFFNEFVPGRVTTGEVTRSIEKLLPELLSKSGDTMPRIHNIAVHTILSLADAPDVKILHIIPVHLTRPLTANTHPRMALSRLQMVEQLIVNHGISNEKQSGMTCRILAEFGSSGLHHPAEAVRKVAEKVLIHVYRVNPRLVRKQLPPDDDITRRNILYRHLLQEFDIIDKENKGEPTKDCSTKMVRSNSESVANSMMYSPPIRQSSSSSSTLEKKNAPALFMHAHTHPSKNLLVTCSSSSSSTGNLTPTCETDKQCIFCLTVSESFSEEGLNIHYWRYCPMLTRCQHCQEVVELSSLYNHLSEECDFKKLYIKCKKCHEPILAKQFDMHRKSSSCIALDGVSKCPLCNELMGSGEDSWRAHYTGSEPCFKNPRLPFIHNY